MSFRQLLTVVVCFLLALTLASGDALSAGKGSSLTNKQVKKFKEKKPREDKRSGDEGRNMHVTLAGQSGMEIVKGRITKVRAGGIVMDGVYFGLAYASMVDDFGKVLKISDLYVGLEVTLKKEYGSVVRLTGKNFIRTGVITDRREIMRKIGSKLPSNPLRKGGAQ